MFGKNGIIIAIEMDLATKNRENNKDAAENIECDDDGEN